MCARAHVWVCTSVLHACVVCAHVYVGISVFVLGPQGEQQTTPSPYLRALGQVLSLSLQLGWWPASPRGSLVSLFHRELQSTWGYGQLLYGCRDLNSGPSMCAASTLTHYLHRPVFYLQHGIPCFLPQTRNRILSGLQFTAVPVLLVTLEGGMTWTAAWEHIWQTPVSLPNPFSQPHGLALAALMDSLSASVCCCLQFLPFFFLWQAKGTNKEIIPTHSEWNSPGLVYFLNL